MSKRTPTTSVGSLFTSDGSNKDDEKSKREGEAQKDKAGAQRSAFATAPRSFGSPPCTALPSHATILRHGGSFVAPTTPSGLRRGRDEPLVSSQIGSRLASSDEQVHLPDVVGHVDEMVSCHRMLRIFAVAHGVPRGVTDHRRNVPPALERTLAPSVQHSSSCVSPRPRWSDRSGWWMAPTEHAGIHRRDPVRVKQQGEDPRAQRRGQTTAMLALDPLWLPESTR